jgi:membrane protein implicated in regulation of membrane protease activity
MYNESTLLLGTGAVGLLFGLAALAAGVQGVATILCGLVFALAALCLYHGWRYAAQSPLARYRIRQRHRRRGPGAADGS